MLLAVSAGCTASAQSPPPPPDSIPDVADYSLTFADEFASPASIAASPATGDAATRWFGNFFFGAPASPAAALRVTGGVLHIQDKVGPGANISTAGTASTAPGWSGQVFRNGGYFEARIALGPDPRRGNTAWPAFWLMAIEHMAGKGAARWPGQPPETMRFVESDIFEYNHAWQKGAYFATMHEWFGRWGECGKTVWCHQSNADDGRRMIPMNPRQRLEDFHVYGQLWVPATKASKGYIQNYLDGREVGLRVEWQAGEPRPPAGARFLYNAIDRQGLAIILTSGAQRMSVDWVRVWQKPDGVIERR